MIEKATELFWELVDLLTPSAGMWRASLFAAFFASKQYIWILVSGICVASYADNGNPLKDLWLQCSSDAVMQAIPEFAFFLGLMLIVSTIARAAARQASSAASSFLLPRARRQSYRRG